MSKKSHSRQLRQLAENLLSDMTAEVEISQAEQAELITSLVRQWLTYFGLMEMTQPVREAALRWSLGRGSRSGRVAWQFARDWAGKEEARKFDLP